MRIPMICVCIFFFFSSRRRHTRFDCDWSSDVCSSDLLTKRNPLSGREWGAKLSAALLKEDERELERLLHSVSWVANELKPNISQTRTLSQMLIRAVRFALRQTVRQAELCSLALTDELTGLFNRRGFLELAVHQLKMARRTSQGALVFYCDMDGLKQINDDCGHDEGDLALLRAAAALKSSFRDSDILARIGGHEFSVLAMEGAGLNCGVMRSEEHTSELQSQSNLVCRLLLEKKKMKISNNADSSK